MRKVVQLDGGIGRVISSTSAIRNLYQRTLLKPTVITAHPEVFWNNPYVYKVYRMDREYLWDDVIKQGEFTYPEPYHNVKYYTQEHHISQSFDYLLGGKGTFGFPQLFLNKEELTFGKNLISHIKEKHKSQAVIAFQPFGAGAYIDDGVLVDRTHRSLSLTKVDEILSGLNPLDMFINCSHIPLNYPNVWQQNFSLRELMSVVAACDFIVSIDSCVHHIGAAYQKTGVLILGPTFAQNIGYPNYEMPTRDGYPKSYFPNRFSGFVDENEGAMAFNEEDTEQLRNIIRERRFPASFGEAMEKSEKLLKEESPYIPKEDNCLFEYTEEGKLEEIEEVKKELPTPIPFPEPSPTPECLVSKVQELPNDPAKTPGGIPKVKRNLDTMF